MTKVDIVSGFLGAGKTTLIKKLIAESFQGEKLVLIENEFGEIGIDGGFLKDAGIEITEMNSGCICCSLVGDFGEALKKVLDQYAPDRIIIEPSGVGKLSDVIKAVQGVAEDTKQLELDSFVTVADASKAKMYMKNFGEFFNNQIESASTIILSRTQKLAQDKLEAVVALLREHNAKAAIITTPWEDLSGEIIVKAMTEGNSLVQELMEEALVCPDCGHHHAPGEECHHDHEHEHHHHDHDEEEHEHHHHHDHDEEEHEHHHHDHDEEEHEHHHHDHDEEEHEHHHHDHDEEEHEHHHHDHDGHDHHHHDHDGHHHHHHADEIFTSWGKETPHKYTDADMECILKELSESQEYGVILRAKGMVPNDQGEWIYFDLVPGEYELRKGSPDYTGKLCVIGSELKEDKLEQLFQLV